MKPVMRSQSQLLHRKSYKPIRNFWIRPVRNQLPRPIRAGPQLKSCDAVPGVQAAVAK